MVAAQAYDATRILIEAIRKAGSQDKEAIRNAIAEIKDFDGVTGTISSFNSLNQAVHKFESLADPLRSSQTPPLVANGGR